MEGSGELYLLRRGGRKVGLAEHSSQRGPDATSGVHGRIRRVVLIAKRWARKNGPRSTPRGALLMLLADPFALLLLTLFISLLTFFSPLPAEVLSELSQRCFPANGTSFFGKKMVRKSLAFPDGFMWGTATASYQIEGAATEERDPSIWDRFSNTPGKVANGDTGLNACDHYHRFKEDVQLIKKLNTKYYRFSIAWPRIQRLSNGSLHVNPPGVAFYNALIDELLSNGITPYATLYHWDLPLSVADETDGWAGSAKVADMFADFARICFEKFGDRVKNWITLNEPWCSAFLGYEIGEHAPGDTTRPGVAVYRAGHNLLLAHAKAVDVYRKEFQSDQGGRIGVTLNANWMEPSDKYDKDSVEAAQRELDFELGWFADPIWKGDYPATMREAAGHRLPSFSKEEKALLQGSSDFFGLNHYSTNPSRGFMTEEEKAQLGTSFAKDKGTVSGDLDKWQKTDMGWAIVPWGFRKLLVYISDRYNPKGGIIVTENGLASQERTRVEMENDSLRVEFYERYMQAMHDAMQAGADVKGYFLWSLMDNFEWAFGYAKRFGLYWVDYDTMQRIPKPASKWYAQVTASNAIEATVCDDEKDSA